MKALVLCGGYGKRLGDLTTNTPKPMLPLRGKPLLAYTLRYLARHGYDRIAINLHHRAEAIRDHFGDRTADGQVIHYTYEPTLLGTAGTMRSLAAFFATEETFLVLYGDLLIDQDLRAVHEAHRRNAADATLLLHRRAGSNSLVRMAAAGAEPGRIVAFIERPSDAERAAAPHPWVNSGLCLGSPALLRHIPERVPADLPRDVFVPHVADARLFGFPLQGYRCAIDSPARYAEAEEAVGSGRYDAANQP